LVDLGERVRVKAFRKTRVSHTKVTQVNHAKARVNVWMGSWVRACHARRNEGWNRRS